MYNHLLRIGCATQHVVQCLDGACEQLADGDSTRLTRLKASLEKLTLVAFSAGCVPLNQLLSEFATVSAQSDKIVDWESDDAAAQLPPLELQSIYKRIGALTQSKGPLFDAQRAAVVNDFFARVRSVHIVDAHRHPTNKALFQALMGDGVHRLEFLLHGTPRQLADTRRPFVSRERDQFIAALGDRVSDLRYFADDPPSLHRHFDALKAFRLSAAADERD